MILELLKQLSKILVAVGPLIIELKSILSNSNESKDLQRAMALQAAIAEQLDNQLKIVQSVFQNIQKSILLLSYVSYAAAGLSIAAIVLWILR